MRLSPAIRPRGESVRRVSHGLIARFNGVTEAIKRVVDERRGVCDAVEIDRKSWRRRVEGEIDLIGEDSHKTACLQSIAVGNREHDAVSREAAEVMSGRRDRERTALHASNGTARVHVPFVQEIDIPCERAGWQYAVLHIGSRSTEGNDIAGYKESAVCWSKAGYCRPIARTDGKRWRER